ncbi:hypothetical protein E4T56_gene18767 [Termitomyces sp. T112]|nr:hypothetical protein E4T56_gene18767 [Termitomyces sp. T112]
MRFVTDASNIGSVLIQVASFGQRRLNNSSKIKYCKSLSDDELDHIICHYENLMQMIANSLKEDAARKSFIVEVKKYRESKAMVEKAMIFVENVSAMTEKRRVDETTNNMRLQRKDEFEKRILMKAGLDGTNYAISDPRPLLDDIRNRRWNAGRDRHRAIAASEPLACFPTAASSRKHSSDVNRNEKTRKYLFSSSNLLEKTYRPLTVTSGQSMSICSL